MRSSWGASNLFIVPPARCNPSRPPVATWGAHAPDGVLDGSAPGPPANVNPSAPFGVDNSPCIGVDGTQAMNGNIDEINITRGGTK